MRCGLTQLVRTGYRASASLHLRDQVADLELANTRLLEPSLKLLKLARPPKVREAVVPAQ